MFYVMTTYSLCRLGRWRNSGLVFHVDYNLLGMLGGCGISPVFSAQQVKLLPLGASDYGNVRILSLQDFLTGKDIGPA